MYRKYKNKKDVLYILNNLRPEDLNEAKSVHGKNWKKIIFSQIMKTDFDVLMGINHKNDVPVCMGGAWHLDKDEAGVGVVWMLSTPDIENHKNCLLRELKKEFVKYDRQYWLLYNFIYKENYYAKNWLKWMGFKFDKPRPIGFNIPKDFEFFYRVRNIKGLDV